ncbi:MAG: NAD(P)/FAD-dependent oxidoreductase [Thermoanaerobaculia bacterium]
MAQPISPRLDIVYDCVIIGGGPAGLTASIFLGRYRRKVLVIDAGEGRNRASRGIHGFLGYHEITPAELRARGRREAEGVGVAFLETRASKLERCGDYFEVATDRGTARGRRVLLAYGVRDELPDLPRFEEFYGRSVFHCPDCDGWEVRDRRIGVIGHGKRVAALALELLHWSDDITIFTDGEDRSLDAEQISKLAAVGIRIIEDPIEELVGEEGVLEQVRLRSGEGFACDAIFFTLGVDRSCPLAEQAGCEVIERRPDVKVDEHNQTTVEGIYAAGDITAGSQLAIKAAADGAIAAIAINRSLLPPAQKV